MTRETDSAQPSNEVGARVPLGQPGPLHQEVVGKPQHDLTGEREGLHAADRLDVHHGDVLDAEQPQQQRGG